MIISLVLCLPLALVLPLAMQYIEPRFGPLASLLGINDSRLGSIVVNGAALLLLAAFIVCITLIVQSTQAGPNQAGRRPVLVLSPTTYNDRVGLAILCPITSQVKGYPFEVLIPEGLEIQGAILSDQVKSLDWRARQAEWACTLPPGTVEEVLLKLSTLLGQ